jgi:hypothetical protein
MDKSVKPFLEWVQVHEREWGTESYIGRPSLQQLLHSPIVVMWSTTDPKAKSRFVFSAHENAASLNEWATGMLIAGKVTMPNRKLAKIFVNQQPVKFGVQIAIEKPTK